MIERLAFFREVKQCAPVTTWLYAILGFVEIRGKKKKKALNLVAVFFKTLLSNMHSG